MLTVLELFSVLVILTAIHTTAISLTLFRVYYRTVSRRLWWDDYAAFVAAVLDCGYISVLWFEYAGQGEPLTFLILHY